MPIVKIPSDPGGEEREQEVFSTRHELLVALGTAVTVAPRWKAVFDGIAGAPDPGAFAEDLGVDLDRGRDLSGSERQKYFALAAKDLERALKGLGPRGDFAEAWWFYLHALPRLKDLAARLRKAARGGAPSPAHVATAVTELQRLSIVARQAKLRAVFANKPLLAQQAAMPLISHTVAKQLRSAAERTAARLASEIAGTTASSWHKRVVGPAVIP